MVFSKIFLCVTNGFVVIPVYYTYKIQLYLEAYIYFLAGLFSLVYHIVYEFDTVDDEKSKMMVSYTDHVVAYTTVSTVLYTLLVTNSDVRHMLIITSIFTEVMFNYITINSFEHLVTSICIASVLAFSYNLYKKNEIFENDDKICIKKHFVIGFTCNTLEGIFFYILAPQYPDDYGLYHGCHHVLGFTAIYYYMCSMTKQRLNKNRSPSNRNRKDSNVTQENIKKTINDIKKNNETNNITIITHSPSMVNRIVRSKDGKLKKNKNIKYMIEESENESNSDESSDKKNIDIILSPSS